MKVVQEPELAHFDLLRLCCRRLIIALYTLYHRPTPNTHITHHVIPYIRLQRPRRARDRSRIRYRQGVSGPICLSDRPISRMISADPVRYAKFYAVRGASVAVNDVSVDAAQAVVDEITKGRL